MSRRRGVLVLTSVALLAIGAVPTDTTAFQDAVTAEGIREHQAAFQAIAGANDGTRASGTPGYDASVDYAVEVLEDAGYDVEVQEFEFPFFVETADPTFAQTAPSAETFVEDEDFATMTFSGSGSVTDAEVVPVDLALDDPEASSSGCEESDFTGLALTGKIALMQRGTCSFFDKAANAQGAGAAAAVVFNQGNTEEREALFFGTLGPEALDGVTIPVLSASFAVGEQLSATGARASITTETLKEIRDSANVLADTATGRDDRVVVVGAHLDSVYEGPGINDNGSGVGLVLEMAEHLAELDIEPRNTVRFALWGSEEFGLLGSEHYVSTLPKSELKDIALNLNFDMVGSPNYVRFVYDGDGSEFGSKGPSGSGAIEQVFLDHFEDAGLEAEPTEFDGRSDYDAFITRGIPAGGLFTGAEGIKSEEEAEVYGGTAGEQYDPCYHIACDTYANVSLDALEEMGDAAAHALLTFAMTRSSVNGAGKASPTAMQAREYQGSHTVR